MIPKALSLVVAVAAVVVSAVPARAADSADWQFLPGVEGDTRVREGVIPMRPAAGGLALAVVGGLWHLEPATIGITRSRERGFLEVSATPPDAAAYLRLPGLSAGKVDAADMRFRGVDHAIDQAGLTVPFKGVAWHLDVRGGKVSLGDGSRRQALMDACPADDDMCALHLVWAGDLDRDGKPDFLIRHTSDDSGDECLYLSSRAKPGQLVGEAACNDHSH